MALPALSLLSRKFTARNLMFGGAPIGGLFAAVPEEQAKATLERAYEVGIRDFDTAPFYGAGLSEELFGAVLSSKPDVRIYTKVGRVLKSRAEISDPKDICDGNDSYIIPPRDLYPVFDYTADGVRKAFAESCRRLRVSKLPCERIHDAESPDRYAAAMKPGWALDELIKMRSEGLIQQVSAGLNDASYLLRFARDAPVGTFNNFLSAGCWNLLDHSGYELFRECQARGIKITIGGAFGSGILWGGETLRYQQAPEEARQRVQRWKALAAHYNLSLPAVALNFSLLPEVVDFVAIGLRSPAEVDSNVELLQHDVPVKLWSDAKQQGLLPDWMPLPH